MSVPSGRTALIVFGGWDGHEPEKVAALLARLLREADFTVELSETLDAFEDREKLANLSLIVHAAQ